MFGFGARTKCAKCESTSFRLKTIEAIDSNFPLSAVHCNKCGAPFGVIQNQNVAALLERQAMLIARLGAKMDRMARQMEQIADAIDPIAIDRPRQSSKHERAPNKSPT